MKKYILFIILIIMLSVLTSCMREPPSTALSEDILNFPYTNYEMHFAPIESAVLYIDDAVMQVALDDPRLIRVLNFLAYSEVLDQSAWLQGYVYQDQIHQLYDSGETMLEISFTVDGKNDNNILKDTPRILISGDSYILFVDPQIAANGIVGEYADRCWPYANIAPSLTSECLSYDGWGSGYWIDILKHCGFGLEYDNSSLN